MPDGTARQLMWCALEGDKRGDRGSPPDVNKDAQSTKAGREYCIEQESQEGK